MKKLIPLGLMLTFLLAAPAYAQQEITVVVNGNSVNMENYPVIENNRTLVPFRSVLEAMGAQIDWDANTKTVTCTLRDNVVEVEIGGDNMLANGESVALDVPAKVIDNRTYVPLRAISEGLGAEVVWDAETKTVSVASAAAETAPSKEDTVTDDASGNNAAGEETADGNAAQQGIAYTMTDYSNPITSGDTSLCLSALIILCSAVTAGRLQDLTVTFLPMHTAGLIVTRWPTQTGFILSISQLQETEIPKALEIIYMS